MIAGELRDLAGQRVHYAAYEGPVFTLVLERCIVNTATSLEEDGTEALAILVVDISPMSPVGFCPPGQPVPELTGRTFVRFDPDAAAFVLSGGLRLRFALGAYYVESLAPLWQN
jgi:hypothetical protein